MVSNMELCKDYVLLSINPKIYPLDVVYSAAYALLDKAYIVLDGDPEEEIIAEIRLKGKNVGKDGKDAVECLKEIGNEFNNELINYAVYKKQSEKNALIRQTIIQRALLTSGFNDESGDDQTNIDDPEDIMVPWEEKHGKGKDEKSD